MRSGVSKAMPGDSARSRRATEQLGSREVRADRNHRWNRRAGLYHGAHSLRPISNDDACLQPHQFGHEIGKYIQSAPGIVRRHDEIAAYTPVQLNESLATPFESENVRGIRAAAGRFGVSGQKPDARWHGRAGRRSKACGAVAGSGQSG